MSIEKYVENTVNYLLLRRQGTAKYVLAAGAVAISACSLLLQPAERRNLDDPDAGRDAAADAYDASPDGDADSDADAPYDTDVADAYDSGPDGDADGDSDGDTDSDADADVPYDTDVADAYDGSPDADGDTPDADADSPTTCTGSMHFDDCTIDDIVFDMLTGELRHPDGRKVHYIEASMAADYIIAEDEYVLIQSAGRWTMLQYNGVVDGDIATGPYTVSFTDVCTRDDYSVTIGSAGAGSGLIWIDRRYDVNVSADGRATIDMNGDGLFNAYTVDIRPSHPCAPPPPSP